MHPHCGYTLLWPIQPLPLLSLSLYLPPTTLFQQLSVRILISSTLTDVSFMILLMLCHSLFLSLFP
jgi:hypothetical protein